jgi:hypothetical protein
VAEKQQLDLSTAYTQGYALWRLYNTETYPQVIHIEKPLLKNNKPG